MHEPVILQADQYGFVVQGGFYFTDEWEGFVRYEWADFDNPPALTGRSGARAAKRCTSFDPTSNGTRVQRFDGSLMKWG